MNQERRTKNPPSPRLWRAGQERRQASALIVVLWVIGILSLIISLFTVDAQIEARIVSYYRKRTKADYLVSSGMEIGALLMIRGEEIRKEKTKYEDDPKWWYDSARRLAEGLNISGLRHALGTNDIVIVDLEPEPARRNVNNLGKSDVEREQNLERILDVGGIPEEMWPQLIESFLDWLDKDNTARMDGAETDDYYATLDNPYKAKNGPLDTINELLDIKGFSQPVLSGGMIFLDEEDEEGIRVKGIGHLLTTYGDGRVNINAASREVLLTLPGVDELVAGAILEEREGWEAEDGTKEFTAFKSVNELYTRIPELDGTIKQYLTTGSTVYRITSTGVSGGVRKRVTRTVTLAGESIRILRHMEEQ